MPPHYIVVKFMSKNDDKELEEMLKESAMALTGIDENAIEMLYSYFSLRFANDFIDKLNMQ